MKETQHIPSGYKSSPLGIIPKDWEVKRLSTSFVVQGGYAFKSEEYQEKGIPIIRISNLPQNDKYVDFDDCVYCNETDIVPKQYHINKSDLLIAMSGATTGKVAIYNAMHTAYLNQRVGLFKQISKEISYSYLTYLVTSDMYDNQLRSLLIAGAQPNIAPSDIEQLRFPIPPIEEQNKIADILSLWDTAISKQTALIEQLTLRKHGLMQQLLTGKKRLKGFEGKWKEVRLGDVALVIGGGTPNTNIPDYWDGNIPWFTPSEIGKYKYVNTSERTISEKGLNDSSAKTLPKGTILFTSRATIGAKAILTTEATTNQGFQSFVVTNGNNNEFIYYYLDIILKEIKQKATGSTFPEVSAESLRKISIKIPSINEQNAIASVLVNADVENEIQKQKLSSLQEQKRGLMQVLLTGKKRVK